MWSSLLLLVEFLAAAWLLARLADRCYRRASAEPGPEPETAPGPVPAVAPPAPGDPAAEAADRSPTLTGARS
jgi:hypothetical protein